MGKKTKKLTKRPGAVIDGQKRLVAVTGEAAAALVKPQKKHKRPKPPVRKRMKTQLTVRVDNTVLDLAYEITRAEGSEVRLTELVERGLLWAVAEYKRTPPIARRDYWFLREVPAKILHACARYGRMLMAPGLLGAGTWDEMRIHLARQANANVEVLMVPSFDEQIFQRLRELETPIGLEHFRSIPSVTENPETVSQ